MITPSNQPNMVTFRIEGWDGVAICPAVQELPWHLAAALANDAISATDQLANWLPPDLGNAIRNASMRDLSEFMAAWAEASDCAPAPDDSPVTLEAADRKTGMTVAELTTFCDAAQAHADEPVRIRIGWSSQITAITVGDEA